MNWLDLWHAILAWVIDHPWWSAAACVGVACGGYASTALYIR